MTSRAALRLRGAVTGLMLVARPSHPTKVFAVIHEGVAWLETRRTRSIAERAEELVDAIVRFCEG